MIPRASVCFIIPRHITYTTTLPWHVVNLGDRRERKNIILTESVTDSFLFARF